MTDVADAELLIIGAGPCGLVAAITAARYGTEVLCVEQRAGGSSLSRALVVSTRGMELMRRIGLEEAVRAEAADVEPTAFVTLTLASPEGNVMPLGYPSDVEAAKRVRAGQRGRTVVLRTVPGQPAASGADCEGAVRNSTDRSPRSGSATVGRRCYDVASTVQHVVDARFVVGADGAHSTVRDVMGFVMDGADDLADYERVEFVASLDEVVGARRHALYVLKHPNVDSAVLARRGREDRWGLSRERVQATAGLDDLSEDDLVALIRTATGVADLDLRVERVSRFTFAAQIAQQYRRGNVFLVGDAAHRLTPRDGNGMNTGIQDGFDIAWKLAWVLRGWAQPQLLDSYESERRPIGRHNVERSADPGGARRPTDEALNWDLDGRMPHVWLESQGARVSTVDLIGDGLTLFTATEDPQWSSVGEATGWTAPLQVVVVDVKGCRLGPLTDWRAACPSRRSRSRSLAHCGRSTGTRASLARHPA